MKKIIFLTAGILLTACSDGNLESIKDRKNDEYEKLEGMFTRPREEVELVEFFDFSSEDSKEAAQMLQNLEKEFGPRLRVQRRHFVIRPQGQLAAEASECARDQGKFEEFYNEFFQKHFGEYDKNSMLEIALQMQLHLEEFESCLDSGIGKNRVAEYKKMGKRSHVTEVPYFIVDKDISFAGLIPYSTLQNLILERFATPVAD